MRSLEYLRFGSPKSTPSERPPTCIYLPIGRRQKDRRELNTVRCTDWKLHLYFKSTPRRHTPTLDPKARGHTSVTRWFRRGHGSHGRAIPTGHCCHFGRDMTPINGRPWSLV